MTPEYISKKVKRYYQFWRLKVLWFIFINSPQIIILSTLLLVYLCVCKCLELLAGFYNFIERLGKPLIDAFYKTFIVKYPIDKFRVLKKYRKMRDIYYRRKQND